MCIVTLKNSPKLIWVTLPLFRTFWRIMFHETHFGKFWARWSLKVFLCSKIEGWEFYMCFFQSLRYLSWGSELLWKVDRMGFFLKIYYYLLFWLWWAFIATHRFSPVAVSRVYSVLRSTHFSLCWLLLLQSTGSRHVGFSSCSAWVQQL